MKSYTVQRAHIGDKDYAVGDVREATPADVKHLVDLGVLVPVEDAAPENKADKPAETKAVAKK